MFKRLCCHAQRLTTPRRSVGVLLLLLLAMALVNFADLPFTGPRLHRVSGGGAFLDVRFFYTGEEAWKIVSSYGAAGRSICLGFYATWDVAIPILAFTFSTMTLTQLWKYEGSKRFLFLAPMAALIFDLLENLSLALVLLGFPAVAGVAGVFTLLKWLAYGTSVGFVLAGLGGRIGKFYQRDYGNP